ncbi:MAG: MbcA/ParS/Xre antitoxin family protein [Aquimonas sp.]|nr:MbcA/ParS/Xre antitoxin family protein [Aquimonas sp.]
MAAPRTSAAPRIAEARPAAEPAFAPDDLAGPGLRTFFSIAQRWGLDTRQEQILLGSPARSTFFRWKRGDIGIVPHDLIERLSYLLGIYKALQVLLPVPERADAWVKRPNSATPFGGQTPLEHMLGGQVVDLYRVRQYLDAERGG